MIIRWSNRLAGAEYMYYGTGVGSIDIINMAAVRAMTSDLLRVVFAVRAQFTAVGSFLPPGDVNSHASS